jgi:hypothetical protein
MSRKQRDWRIAIGVLAACLCVVGAILAFALDNDKRAIGDIRMEPLGVILLSAGVVLLVGLWMATLMSGGRGGGGTGPGDPNGPDDDGPNSGGAGATAAAGGLWNPDTGLHTVAGLIAVIGGIVAVCVLSAITLTRLSGSNDKEAIVAITTTAFGIISAVVGAYLGIKVSSTAAESANVNARRTAAVSQAAHSSQQEFTSLKGAVQNALPDEQADKVFAEFGRTETPDTPR